MYIREALIIVVCKFWIAHHEDWRLEEVKGLFVEVGKSQRTSNRLLLGYEAYTFVQIVVSDASFSESIDPAGTAQVDQYC